MGKIELKVFVHYIGTVNLKQKYTDMVHWIYLQFPNITKTIVLLSEAWVTVVGFGYPV